MDFCWRFVDFDEDFILYGSVACVHALDIF